MNRPRKPGARSTQRRSSKPRSQKNAAPSARASRWEKPRTHDTGDAFFISGVNGVRECLASSRVKVKRLWVNRRSIAKDFFSSLPRELRIPVETLETRETPYGLLSQGVAALVVPPEDTQLADLFDHINTCDKKGLILALDQVEDPMNLGQILRTCNGAGVDGVILLKHRGVHLNQTVAQVSQGAFAWVPVVQVTNLRAALELGKQEGYWVVGCDGGGNSEPWYHCNFKAPTILVFGSEGRGIRSLTTKTCDRIAALPMAGRLDSLNVGASVAAMLYEVVRQRSI